MQSSVPPKLAKRFFKWYAGSAEVDDLLGDMDEIYLRNINSMPVWRAKMKYWIQVFSLITSYAITKRRQRASLHPHSNDSINMHMLRNYFLIAGRMIKRNKVYTIINVLGLTLGISACIIVFLVVNHQFSFDKFHADGDRIYRLKMADMSNNWICDCVPGPAFPSLRDDYSGAEALTAYHEFDAKVTIVDKGEEKRFSRNEARIIFTTPEFFKIFQHEWMAGNPAMLSKPMHVVLTESRAKTYFGSEEIKDIVGKTIIYNDSLPVTVAGVVKDWKENSDFKRTEFISFSTIENTYLKGVTYLENWGIMMHSSQSFIKLRSNETPVEVASQLTNIIKTKTKEAYSVELQPLSKIHFNMDDEGGSDMLSTLYALMGLAGFILIIAAINFINLSTAQSIGRAREIGIRKVMGSQKYQIIVQFLSETIVLSLIALCFSIALVKPLLNAFSSYLPAGVTFDPLSPDNWMFFGSMLLLISLLAGAYPALIISSYNPAITLSGKLNARGVEGWSLRKLLIIFQFSVSLFFIIATLVISDQMDFIRNEDRGFSTTSVITFNTNWRGEVSKVKTLANKLRTVTGLNDVTQQGFTPMGFAKWGGTFEYQGKNDKVNGDVSIKSGDEHYIPLYKIRLLAGRNISAADSLNEVVINEALLKTLGFQDPNDAVGEVIRIHQVSVPIVGVVKDFHQRSFRDPIEPCVIGQFVHEQHSIAIRLDNPDLLANADVIAKIEAEYKQVYPDEPFEFHFIEDEIGQMHGEEQRTSSLATIAMAVTIFISCMGVFGLAMFTANMRTKEIGIRKVLGASSLRIVNMLSWEFIILILISIALATPIAWYYMNNWLLGFSYRTDLSWWMFAGAGAIALFTGLITVSFQSFKAAMGDPVKALRTE